MSVDTLNKNVLKMLSHLNKYPIPDPQMVKDFRWFINTYNLSVKSGEVTAPGSGPSPEGYVNDVIFSGLSFAPTFSFPVTSYNVNSNTNPPGTQVGNIYTALPAEFTFNSNRAIGIRIELVSSINIQPNNTIDVIGLDENDLITILDTVEIGTIQGGYTYGYVDTITEDNVYIVNPTTFQISPSNYTFYKELGISVNTFGPSSLYTFKLTHYFV